LKREVGVARQPKLPSEARRKAARGSHHHVAELYGESETRGLTTWARERVLARAR